MMNRNMGKTYYALFLISALCVDVWGQKSPEKGDLTEPVIVQAQSQPGTVPQDWIPIPRPPIRFTPFDLIDPLTGKSVSPDDVLEIEGHKIRAGDLYRQINEMERWLNQYGYSLRDSETIELYSPTLAKQIADSEYFVKWLEANAPLSPEPPESTDSGCDFAPAGGINYYNAWASPWLGNSYFGLQVGYSVLATGQLNGPATYVSLSGNAFLRGMLVGWANNLVDARGIGAISPGGWYYDLNVSVLGRQVWRNSSSGQLGAYQNRWNFPIASFQLVTPPIPLLCVTIFVPICAYGQAGIYGDVGVDAGVTLSPYEQVAFIAPRVYSGGWAAGWIGVYLGFLYAEIGVVGQINFFSGELRGYVRGTPSYTQGSPTSYRLTAGLDTTVSALNGVVLGFLRGCVWFFGWHCNQWYLPLFSWNGWHYHGSILYWDHTFY